jgi:hypothetical protein
MYSVEAKLAENQLALSVSDPVIDSDLSKIAGAVQREARKLKSGWTGAVDLRGMKVLKPENLKVMGEVQVALKAGGAGKIGTLLASAILQGQLSRMARQAQTENGVRRFSDEAEWRTFLKS